MKIHKTHSIVNGAIDKFCRQCECLVRGVDADTLEQPCDSTSQGWFIRMSQFTDKELETLRIGLYLASVTEKETAKLIDEIVTEIKRRK